MTKWRKHVLKQHT